MIILCSIICPLVYHSRCCCMTSESCNYVLLQAFASQFVYCRKKLELDPEKINVNGGAMAIGHPLGATGITARIIVT